MNSTARSYVAGLSVSTANWNTILYEKSSQSTVVDVNCNYRAHGPNIFGDSSAAEANRRTGDMQIYSYYFKSIGRLPTILFAITLSLFVFAFSFPSMSYSIICKDVPSLPVSRLTFGKMFG